MAKHRSRSEGKTFNWVHKTELLNVIDPKLATSQIVILSICFLSYLSKAPHSFIVRVKVNVNVLLKSENWDINIKRCCLCLNLVLQLQKNPLIYFFYPQLQPFYISLYIRGCVSKSRHKHIHKERWL